MKKNTTLFRVVFLAVEFLVNVYFWRFDRYFFFYGVGYYTPFPQRSR